MISNRKERSKTQVTNTTWHSNTVLTFIPIATMRCLGILLKQ